MVLCKVLPQKSRKPENSGSSGDAQQIEPSASCQVHDSGLVGSKDNSEGGKKANNNVPNDRNKLFCREFKIRKQIGVHGTDDKLPFINLIRQIESAITKLQRATARLKSLMLSFEQSALGWHYGHF